MRGGAVLTNRQLFLFKIERRSTATFYTFDSSEEFVGNFRFWKLAK